MKSKREMRPVQGPDGPFGPWWELWSAGVNAGIRISAATATQALEIWARLAGS